MLLILSLWLFMSLFLYFILLYLQKRCSKENNTDDVYTVVTAHPDDECMFFGPFLGFLSERSSHMRLLCLSSGNFYGLGKLRERELFKAAEKLGFSSENVDVVDDDRIPDSLHKMWPADVVVEHCQNNMKYMEKSQRLIVTFDEFGVSKHPNHISVSTALQANALDKKRLFKLISLPIIVQYMGPVTCIPIVLFISLINRFFARHNHKIKHHVVVASPSQWRRTILAMFCHKSQMMWFRILHLLLSSYLLINIVEEEIHSDD